MSNTGIVQPDWTNAPIVTILFNQILLLQRNNIITKKSGNLSSGIVQRVWNIVNNDRGKPISWYILDNVVFSIAAIPRNEDWPKSTVYQVVQQLESLGIVEKTLFKAVNPDPSYTGPKARFYKVSGYDLAQGWKDPYLKQAQEAYSASFRNSPEHIEQQSNEDILTSISPKIIDYYTSRGEFRSYTRDILTIRKHIDQVYPHLEKPLQAELAQKVQHQLYNTKEVSNVE